MEVSGQFHAPAALPPGKDPDTHCMEGWVEPKAGLDAVPKRKKILSLLPPGIEPRSSSP
jgi:hypothetical protein